MSDYEKLPYGAYKDDNRGFRHSIDKLIIDYPLNSDCSFSDFLHSFSCASSFQFVSDRGEDGYNSYFDKPPCSFYSWFQSAFWFSHCNCKLGFYYHDTYNGKKAEYQFKKLMRVEFNPNKVFQDALFVSLISVIKDFFGYGYLVEVDYSVDLPYPCNEVITQSRKTKIIYNDSRYYGKRHTNGRLKVYNKKREVHDKEKIDLSGDLTRCEVTYRCDSDISILSCFLASGHSDCSCLSSNLRSISDLLLLCSSYGEDIEELLCRFVPDKRNRDKLEPVVLGERVVIFDFVRFFELLVFYADLYHFAFHFTGTLGQHHNLDKIRRRCDALDWIIRCCRSDRSLDDLVSAEQEGEE